MTREDFKLAKHIIEDTLKKEDIENKDGIMSYYDMIKYAKNNMKDLTDILKDKYSFERRVLSIRPLVFRSYVLDISSTNDTNPDNCKSTIAYASPLSTGIIFINKNKNSKTLNFNTKNHDAVFLVKSKFNSIMETFNIVEKYSEFFDGMEGKVRCSVDVYGIFFIKTHYSDYGNTYTEIGLNSKYDTEQYFDGINLEKILKENKDNILKKLPINLNENFKDVGNNHIYLLAQKEYYKEKEKNKQLVKKISK